MIAHIEHVGIAVTNPEKAKDTFEKLLDRKREKSETVLSENVETHFFRVGESQIELLESLNPNGVISKFIEKKGQGMHHLALRTDDIYFEINRLKTLGFEFLSDSPKQGADNKLIIFLHPKSTEGVLIELCQDIIP
jgi:methylmalonyl-CoA/ethylmalonyl-CoA epimerase